MRCGFQRCPTQTCFQSGWSGPTVWDGVRGTSETQQLRRK
ncbi:mCG113690 [Mus musculus]|nr:mCG113690 [Mus musculus]